MKKLENLTQIINKNLKHITVTDSMKKHISSNFNEAPTRRFKRIRASIVTCFAVMFLIITIWGDNTVYAFNHLIKYLPGINFLISDNKGSETFALDGTLTIKSENGSEHIEILSCFTDGNTVKAVIESNVPVDWNKNDSILAIDNRSIVGKLVKHNIMSDGLQDSPDYEWIGIVNFEFNNIVDKFDLKLGGFKFPIIMSKIEGVTNFKDFGNVSYANGVYIAALTKYINNLLEVKIIGLSDDGKNILNFANGNVYVIDKLGNRYSPISPPNTATSVADNTFYFDARLKSDLKLIVPYIILTDNKKVDIKLELPPVGNNLNVNFPFTIDNYCINIVELQRTINVGKPNLRQPDGKNKKTFNYSTTGLQIVVDKKFEYSMKDGLYDFSYTCDNNYSSISGTSNGKKIYYVPGNDSSDKKYSGQRYKIINLPNIPLDKKSLDIIFTEPQYYCKGDWSIILKK